MDENIGKIAAENYLAENIDTLKEYLRKAFIEGVKCGEQLTDHTITIDNVEYIDLNLPSGTLWSSSPISLFNYGTKLRLFSYAEAQKLPIPTIDDWNELNTYCKVLGKGIIGSNSARIGYVFSKTNNPYLVYDLGEKCETGKNKFWLKGDTNTTDNTASAFCFDSNVLNLDKHFVGFKLPVFLIHKKEK